MQTICNKLIIVIIIVLCFSGCHRRENGVQWNSSDGYIPNETTAAKVAEIIWLNVYGEGIEDNKPFKVRLKEGNIWLVEGTFNGKGLGGVPYMEIQKSDGKILKVSHGK